MPTPDWKQLKHDLMALHLSALRAADPKIAVSATLNLEEGGNIRVGESQIELPADARIWIIAAGKASIGMTDAALEILGNRVAGGVASFPRALGRPGHWPDSIQSFGSGHPLPDEKSFEAGAAVVVLAAKVQPGDLVLALISGGGSALLEKLREGIELEQIQALTQALQHAGANILELNIVRRALSVLKGGGILELVRPAQVVTLAMSDVLNDRPEAIASGPTVESSTGPADALNVLKRFKLESESAPVVEVLKTAIEEEPEKPQDGAKPIYLVVGSNRMAGQAVVEEAGKLGFESLLLTTCIQGEANEVGKMIGGLAQGVRAHQVPFAAPACLVLGGETTVTVSGDGKGGRNLELAMGAAATLAELPRVAVLAFATDGVDGSADAAGAVATGETMTRCRSLQLSPEDYLEKSNSWAFFQSLGDLWVTGPTGTNVNDLAVVLVYP